MTDNNAWWKWTLLPFTGPIAAGILFLWLTHPESRRVYFGRR